MRPDGPDAHDVHASDGSPPARVTRRPDAWLAHALAVLHTWHRER
ncbi:hypothetical protein NX794_17340 [Streptomyces sp. LP11]|uniref:Uncharacterized protein n=1 Tax=Streptomyces pyxinicus TaxID=2970331 RepID=A0ABT2B387_9ACTN|nr:hypothetical protein [Streptomyces sp. LP11]MCS0602962.1 hypothetical protein [Streptomyces sp. LP11]